MHWYNLLTFIALSDVKIEFMAKKTQLKLVR